MCTLLKTPVIVESDSRGVPSESRLFFICVTDDHDNGQWFNTRKLIWSQFWSTLCFVSGNSDSKFKGNTAQVNNW